MLSLRDIEASIANTSAFPLHEGNLGSSPYGVLKELFYLQPEARLINCKINSSDEKSLWFSGDCSDLFPWKDVAVKTECFLFDVSNERHSLFRIQIPDGYDAYYYLCRYSYAPGELSAEQFAEFTKLETLLAATDDSTGIAFKQPAMVFSSVDFDSKAA